MYLQAYFPIVFSEYNANGPFTSPPLAEDEGKFPGQNSINTTITNQVNFGSKNVTIQENIKSINDSEEYLTDTLFKTRETNNHRQDRLSGDGGFWREYGYGMACVYQEDAMRVGGLPELSRWGGEDLEFFKKFANLPGMEVSRLTHRGTD